MNAHDKRNLYIAGFMGTGKSTIGPIVAKKLKRRFHDLDTVIEAQAGRSVETIFQTEGESRFRTYEVSALESLAGTPASVIALGGGAPTTRRIVEVVQRTGWTVLLTADIDTILKRVDGGRSRPLLKTDGGEPLPSGRLEERIGALLASRTEAYRDIADWTIDTGGHSAEENARRIVQLIAGTLN